MAVASQARPGTPNDAGIDAAYAWCRAFARAHEENFTVISWMLPAKIRPHFASLYSFCRMTDDLGDEAEGDRLAQLDEWDARLRACFAGERSEPLFTALGATIDRFDIPADPFLRLIEANRMDQRTTRFASYDDLLRYCSFSATPVGQMVLYVLGYRDEQRQALSDATCIGLQLANFWQDVSVDIDKGRVYIPQEDLARFGIAEAELSSGQASDGFKAMMRFEVERAQALFD
ncbi:MAG: squalene synthase HpnC, partial [Tepidiformaceae bacterium]